MGEAVVRKKRRPKPRGHGTLLWSCAFSGGAVAGMGLFLLAQVRLVEIARHRMHEEVGAVGRFLGRITFRWRKPNEKIFLALDEIPSEVLHNTELVARWMIGLGLLGLAIAVPLLLRVRGRRG